MIRICKGFLGVFLWCLFRFCVLLELDGEIVTGSVSFYFCTTSLRWNIRHVGSRLCAARRHHLGLTEWSRLMRTTQTLSMSRRRRWPRGEGRLQPAEVRRAAVVPNVTRQKPVSLSARGLSVPPDRALSGQAWHTGCGCVGMSPRAGRGPEQAGWLLLAAAERGERDPAAGAREGKRRKVFGELNHRSCLFPSVFVLPLLNSDTYTIACLLKTMLEFPTLSSANKCVLN